MTYIELKAKRAKRGMAAAKAKLLEEYRLIDGCVGLQAIYLIPLGGSAPKQEHVDKYNELVSQRDSIEQQVVALCV